MAIADDSNTIKAAYDVDFLKNEIVLRLDRNYLPWGSTPFCYGMMFELTLNQNGASFYPIDGPVWMSSEAAIAINSLNRSMTKLTDVNGVKESLLCLGVDVDSIDERSLDAIRYAFVPRVSGGSSIGVNDDTISALYNFSKHEPYWVQLIVDRVDPATYVDGVLDVVKYVALLMADAVREAMGMQYVNLAEGDSIKRIRQRGRLL